MVVHPLRTRNLWLLGWESTICAPETDQAVGIAPCMLQVKSRSHMSRSACINTDSPIGSPIGTRISVTDVGLRRTDVWGPLQLLTSSQLYLRSNPFTSTLNRIILFSFPNIKLGSTFLSPTPSVPEFVCLFGGVGGGGGVGGELCQKLPPHFLPPACLSPPRSHLWHRPRLICFGCNASTHPTYKPFFCLFIWIFLFVCMLLFIHVSLLYRIFLLFCLLFQQLYMPMSWLCDCIYVTVSFFCNPIFAQFCMRSFLYICHTPLRKKITVKLLFFLFLYKCCIRRHHQDTKRWCPSHIRANASPLDGGQATQARKHHLVGRPWKN